MAHDNKAFNKAMREWEKLHEQKAYSLPKSLGKTAILLPFDHTRPFSEGVFNRMRRGAMQLADVTLARTSVEPEVVLNASRSDIESVLCDPEISSIIYLGRGSLSAIQLECWDGKRDFFTWKDVARSADHLKMGPISQLQCGGRSNDLNVPLGTFAASDPRAVYIPRGYVSNHTPVTRVAQKLVPLTNSQIIDLDYIVTEFARCPYSMKDSGHLLFDRLRDRLASDGPVETAKKVLAMR